MSLCNSAVKEIKKPTWLKNRFSTGFNALSHLVHHKAAHHSGDYIALRTVWKKKEESEEGEKWG